MILCSNASCKVWEKLIPCFSARSFSHWGRVRVFFTERSFFFRFTLALTSVTKELSFSFPLMILIHSCQLFFVLKQDSFPCYVWQSFLFFRLYKNDDDHPLFFLIPSHFSGINLTVLIFHIPSFLFHSNMCTRIGQAFLCFILGKW